MKRQTETLRDEVNNLSADLFQNENQRNDTEYTVGRVNINASNIDYRTPGHLTEREDRLFKSLQDLLNKAGFHNYFGFGLIAGQKEDFTLLKLSLTVFLRPSTFIPI